MRDAIVGVGGETFADHFFVTRLEDVQRQRRSREENDVERE